MTFDNKWLKELIITTGISICKDFVIDNENREAFNKIFWWLAGIENEGIEPTKGLAFLGSFGAGKDVAMRLTMQLASNPIVVEKTGLKRGARMFSAQSIRDDILNSLLENKVNDYYEWNKSNGKPTPINISITDLGKEEKRLMVFGNETNPLERILCCRYDIWQRSREFNDKKKLIFTHFSTNLEPAQIAENYGIRVLDRCKEMFNIIQFYGKSRRK